MSQTVCHLVEDLAIFLNRNLIDQKTLFEYSVSFVSGFAVGIVVCELVFG